MAPKATTIEERLTRLEERFDELLNRAELMLEERGFVVDLDGGAWGGGVNPKA
jgi:hypothetical protein